MLSETLDETYFQRMKSSLGDKARIAQYLDGETVLDVGAGGGELAEFMRHAGFDVTALDGSYASIERIQEAFPKLTALKGMADELPYLVEANSFDNIVCCSVLHEVYSYGTQNDAPYSTRAVHNVLSDLYRTLKPGGKLIIRDGIMPHDWDKTVQIRFKTDDGKRFLKSYSATAPFWNSSQRERTVNLDFVDSHTVQGNLGSAMEFLYTYTWGWASSKREMSEFYGVFTESSYRTVLETVGFAVDESAAYLQPGYYENLSPLVELTDSKGNAQPFPASNCFLVAHKLSH